MSDLVPLGRPDVVPVGPALQTGLIVTSAPPTPLTPLLGPPYLAAPEKVLGVRLAMSASRPTPLLELETGHDA